jgi:hypothetical protein
MGRVVNDNCGVMPPTFMEALASCIVKNSNGDKYLNVICYNDDCQDMSSGVDCGEHVDPENFVVANAFGVDSCGNMALKLRVCVVADAETPE